MGAIHRPSRCTQVLADELTRLAPSSLDSVDDRRQLLPLCGDRSKPHVHIILGDAPEARRVERNDHGLFRGITREGRVLARDVLTAPRSGNYSDSRRPNHSSRLDIVTDALGIGNSLRKNARLIRVQ